MPYKEPGTLTDDQVYAVTAYILKLNGIITDTEAMNAETLPKVVMPNRNGFIPDARPDTPRRPGQKFWPIPAPPKPTPPTASPKQ
jgi:cytochrome c